MSDTDTDTDTDTDVVIIGYGPVGATLAGLLARRGVRTTVVDRDVDVYPLPRAAHVDGETVRIVQELGRIDEMVSTMRVNAGMDFLTADHQVLISMRSPGLLANGWPSSQFINQPLFDRQIREAVAATDADVRLGVAVTSLTQSDDGVCVALADGTQLTARYVVGCDGARSFVRKALGTVMDDLQFEEPWLVVDLVLEGECPLLPEHALQVCDPARPHTVVPMPEPRFRFEFMLLPGEDPVEMQSAETVQRLLAPWIPDGAASIERSAVYTFHGLIAERWREGRVLLAGDAAHQMPPFLGQGMCSGLRDAANLAWKLEAVLHGAPDELLDTYQAEREGHVRAIVEAAVSFGRIICTTDTTVAAERDAGLLAARAAAGAQDAPANEGVPMPPLGGDLVGPGGGVPAAQPTVDGRRLDDLVGSRWLVVGRDATAVSGPGREGWDRLGALVLDATEHPALSSVLDHVHLPDGTTPSVVAVRPDRYVHGGADTLAHLPVPAVVLAS